MKILQKKHCSRLALLSGIALVSAGAAVAADDYSSDKFRSLDTDRDGYLSQTELESSASYGGSFSSLDSNRDGRISSSEFSASSEPRGSTGGSPMTFESLDTDRDGMLSSGELAGAGESRSLDQFDSNRDGRVSRDEYERAAPGAGSSSPEMDTTEPATPGESTDPGMGTRQEDSGVGTSPIP